MYHVDFLVAGEVEETVSHTEADETVWMMSGLDLMDKTYYQAEQFAYEVEYALQTFKAESEYLVREFGGERYHSVLDFLVSLHKATEGRSGGTVEVRW